MMVRFWRFLSVVTKTLISPDRKMSKFLVFGITAQIGCKKEMIYNFFKEKKDEFNYEYNSEIVISEFLGQCKNQAESQTDRYSSLIDIGNNLRKKSACDEILAIKAISDIVFILKKLKKDNKKTQVFVISSLKHNNEIEALKKTFGINFFLIGLYSSEEKRSDNMKAEDKNLNEDKINELFERDQKEIDNHGQQMEKIFKKSDIFIDLNDNPEKEMERFLELLYGHPFHTPKKNELFMYLAYAASARSASFSRQVGAVIVSEKDDLISIGCNEVPKSGGGQYWADDDPDHREFKLAIDNVSNSDSNKLEIEKISEDILNKLMQFNKDNSQIEIIQNCIKSSSLFDVIEFFREEHAETEAISSCGRNGRSTLKSKLYCTTLPCHLCLKAIITAGIQEVFYIEPYSKSKTKLFETESTFFGTNSEDQKKVKLKKFFGIGPRNFLNLFSVTLSAGSEPDRKNGINTWRDQKDRIPKLPLNNIINIINNFEYKELKCSDTQSQYSKIISEMNQKIKEILEIKKSLEEQIWNTVNELN